MNAKQIAKMFGCTEDQARAQYARNAAQLAGMQHKARTSQRKVNGYTADELGKMAAKMYRAATE